MTYRSTGGGYINDRDGDTSIAPDVLEELEVLSITYRVDVNLPAPLTSLVIDQPVTDRVVFMSSLRFTCEIFTNFPAYCVKLTISLFKNLQV